MNRVNTTEMYLNTLPSNHQQLLSRYSEHLTNIRKCIDENNKVIRKIIQDVDKMFDNSNHVTNTDNDNSQIQVRFIDLDKVNAFG